MGVRTWQKLLFKLQIVKRKKLTESKGYTRQRILLDARIVSFQNRIGRKQDGAKEKIEDGMNGGSVQTVSVSDLLVVSNNDRQRKSYIMAC